MFQILKLKMDIVKSDLFIELKYLLAFTSQSWENPFYVSDWFKVCVCF